VAEPEGPTVDVHRLIEVFAGHGVDYLLIGGLAARLYGAERATYDMDVLAARTLDNLDRIADALRELNAFLRVGGLDDETARALPIFIDGSALSALEISTWRTEAGDIDVLSSLRDVAGRSVDFAELAERSSRTVIDGVAVRLAALDDIIQSKRFADRPKDREALPELERLRDEDS
jgi:hypothetical protein